MTDKTSATEKRTAVDHLSFDAKTAKRVGWEAWEFTIAGPHQVKVTNASYGAEKANHAYVVGVETRGDGPVPAECECPADVHRNPDCKHKVALATVGGPTALRAAVDCENSAAALSMSNQENVPTAADTLQTDGGTATSTDEREPCPNGNSRCNGPESGDLRCFECFVVADSQGGEAR